MRLSMTNLQTLKHFQQCDQASGKWEKTNFHLQDVRTFVEAILPVWQCFSRFTVLTSARFPWQLLHTSWSTVFKWNKCTLVRQLISLFCNTVSKKAAMKETLCQWLNSLFSQAFLSNHTLWKVRLKQNIFVLVKSQTAHQELKCPSHTTPKGSNVHAKWEFFKRIAFLVCCLGVRIVIFFSGHDSYAAGHSLIFWIYRDKKYTKASMK